MDKVISVTNEYKKAFAEGEYRWAADRAAEAALIYWQRAEVDDARWWQAQASAVAQLSLADSVE